MEEKKYEKDAKVNFRGIKFQFPMKVHGVLKTRMSSFSRNYMWIKTDSIGGKNISAKWFFDFDNQWKKPDEISDELKQTLTYGVMGAQRPHHLCQESLSIPSGIQHTRGFILLLA
ncbi:hypothetical protein [Dyadobacter sp. CY347]|uniref:hypothetical protein n=1 Tax=Dyadobacter sp. CY347 TaxID=2909336 RepID=UPI001F175C01|nr:hypothetical protein [Dyadobacter sp. CY347]MCF2489700.1 hypothetical protein [Dyadobacter sp. CY347]